MIQICARPTDEPIVNREGVYVLEFKLGRDAYLPLMKVRARTGALAEEKLMFVFEHELLGKELSFNLDELRFNIRNRERRNENGLPDEGEVQGALQEG